MSFIAIEGSRGRSNCISAVLFLTEICQHVVPLCRPTEGKIPSSAIKGIGRVRERERGGGMKTHE